MPKPRHELASEEAVEVDTSSIQLNQEVEIEFNEFKGDFTKPRHPEDHKRDDGHHKRPKHGGCHQIILDFTGLSSEQAKIQTTQFITMKLFKCYMIGVVVTIVLSSLYVCSLNKIKRNLQITEQYGHHMAQPIQVQTPLVYHNESGLIGKGNAIN